VKGQIFNGVKSCSKFGIITDLIGELSLGRTRRELLLIFGNEVSPDVLRTVDVDDDVDDNEVGGVFGDKDGNSEGEDDGEGKDGDVDDVKSSELVSDDVTFFFFEKKSVRFFVIAGEDEDDVSSGLIPRFLLNMS